MRQKNPKIILNEGYYAAVKAGLENRPKSKEKAIMLLVMNNNIRTSKAEFPKEKGKI